MFLITPQTPDDRIGYIDKVSEGFIYMVSRRTQTIIAKQDAREKIAQENNAKEIDADKSTKKIHNELVEEFEANLSINKGLTREDADFTFITKVKGGKRVLDTDLLNQAREKALAKKQNIQERVQKLVIYT